MRLLKLRLDFATNRICTVAIPTELTFFSATGYLLSREGLRLFIEEALPHPEKCYAGIRPDFHGWEDAEMGNCMHSVSVFPETLFDNKGRNRLLTYNPAEYLTTTVPTHRTWKHVSLPNLLQNLIQN